jgi:ABC-type polysaccharide/polyol phosphate transport system ATPase subunit
MKSRLGISVATAFKPDLLLIDEVLGVGDATFRKKSEDRVKEMINESGSVIVVSHSLGLLKNICTRILVLKDGDQIFVGEPSKGIEIYASNTVPNN